MNETPVVVEQTYDQSPEDLWSAITRVDRMKLWFFENIPEFLPKVGFTTEFVVESGERRFNHLWKITEVIPGRKIVYNWRYEGYPGDSIVTFEILDQDKGSGLRVIHEVLEEFPREIPEFTRESCLGGWKYFLEDRLKAYLKG